VAFREVLRRMTWDGKIVLEPQPDGSYVANSFFMPLVVPPRTPKTRKPRSGGTRASSGDTTEVRNATETTQPVLDTLEFAVFKMADELDVSPRRARRALSRLLERLRAANLTLEAIQLELTQVLARD